MKKRQFHSKSSRITRKGGRGIAGAVVAAALVVAMLASLLSPLGVMAVEETQICGFGALHEHDSSCLLPAEPQSEPEPDENGQQEADTEDDGEEPGGNETVPGDGEGSDNLGDSDGTEDFDDADEVDIDDEEAESGESEDETGGLLSTFDAGRLSNDDIDDYIPFIPGFVARLNIPVVKHLGGDGALEELRRLAADASNDKDHFRIEIRDIGRQSRVDAGGYFGFNIPNDPIGYVNFNIDNFVNEVGLYSEISEEGFLTADVKTHSSLSEPQYFIISEKIGTAGENWIYDTNMYLIEVVIPESGIGIAVNSMTVSTDPNTNNKVIGNRTPIGGVEISGLHNMRNPNIHVPTADRFWLIDNQEYLYDGVQFEHFRLTYGELEENGKLDDILALCADWMEPSPGAQADPGAVEGVIGEEYERKETRDHSHSAFAYSLYSENDGARITMAEFDDLFGFVDNPGPGQLEKISNLPESEEFRKVLMQYAVWYYEDVNKCVTVGDKYDPSRYCLFNPHLTNPPSQNRFEDAWPYNPENVYDRLNGFVKYSANLYMDFTRYAGTDKGEYLLHVLRSMAVMMDAYNHGEGCEPIAYNYRDTYDPTKCYIMMCDATGCLIERVGPHPIMKLGRCIDKNADDYSRLSGESISKLRLEQGNIYISEGNPAMNLTVRYVGYWERWGYWEYNPRIRLTLTWSEESDVTVKVVDGGSQRELTRGSRVYPDEIIQVTFNGSVTPVTFTLSDTIISLAHNSVRGSLLTGTGFLSSEELVGTVGLKPPSIEKKQDLILGTAQFMTLSYTVTIGGNPLRFTNFHTVFEFPITSGISADMLYITGAFVMLISAAAIFMGNVRPVKQTAQGAGHTRMRLISRSGKRLMAKKEKRRYDQLE